MPLHLTDKVARELFSRHLEPEDGELAWVHGIDTPSLSLFLLLLGPLVSAWMTRYYLLGLTQRRVLLITLSRWYKEKDCRSIDFGEITGAKVVETRDPYRVGPLVAMPGKFLSFDLKDGTRYRMGSLKDFKGVPGHGASLERIAAFLTAMASGKVPGRGPVKSPAAGKLRVACPQCSKGLVVPEGSAGKKVKCPGCGEPLLVTKPL
jgi:hypothetical protein